MDPEEAFELLSNTLVSRGFGAVVDQVNNTIEAGKITTKKLNTFKYVNEDEYIPARLIEGNYSERIKSTNRRATFGVVEEYKETEKLALLLQAIRRATVSIENIRDSILDILDDEINSVEIIASPDTGSLQMKQFRVVDDTTDHSEMENTLKNLLESV